MRAGCWGQGSPSAGAPPRASEAAWHHPGEGGAGAVGSGSRAMTAHGIGVSAESQGQQSLLRIVFQKSRTLAALGCSVVTVCCGRHSVGSGSPALSGSRAPPGLELVWTARERGGASQESCYPSPPSAWREVLAPPDGLRVTPCSRGALGSGSIACAAPGRLLAGGPGSRHARPWQWACSQHRDGRA